MKENLNREELSAAISETRKSFDTDNPVVPFIEGDGIGIDLWPASQLVFDSAVKKAYNNHRKINWMGLKRMYFCISVQKITYFLHFLESYVDNYFHITSH